MVESAGFPGDSDLVRAGFAPQVRDWKVPVGDAWQLVRLALLDDNVATAATLPETPELPLVF